MKRRILLIMTVVVILSLVLATNAMAFSASDLAQVREATAQFHRPEAARDAGYDLREGLDYCFNRPGTGGMGYHYINIGLLDTTIELLHPEAMVYTPSPNGLQLGAVEYIVPAALWDAEHAELPELLGKQFHLNERLGVYVLHAWIWKNNPAGIFEDWNPGVSCPE